MFSDINYSALSLIQSELPSVCLTSCCFVFLPCQEHWEINTCGGLGVLDICLDLDNQCLSLRLSFLINQMEIKYYICFLIGNIMKVKNKLTEKCFNSIIKRCEVNEFVLFTQLLQVLLWIFLYLSSVSLFEVPHWNSVTNIIYKT